MPPTRPEDYGRKKDLAPFPAISDAAPFSRIFSATLHTDADQPILPLVLFVQKDAYADDPALSSLYNNVRMEKQWQNLFSAYRGSGASGAPLLLKDQISHDHTLLPFQPLFFCRSKKVYFPPACPRCGRALHLCRNDALLNEYGLPFYSTTLERFLFCDLCVSAGMAVEFYAFEKKPDDPDWVIDQTGLIRKTGLIGEGPGPDKSPVPCPDCSQRQTCYGPEESALERISVFSLYPFYMLAFRADQISAADHGRLESGAALTKPGERTAKEGPLSGAGKEEQPVAAVLQRILLRWRSEMKSSPATLDPGRMTRPSRGGHAGSQDIAETVIISKNRAESAAGVAPAGDALAKTRILRPASKKAVPAKNNAADNAGGMEKTRIITPAANKAPSSTNGGYTMHSQSVNGDAAPDQAPKGKPGAEKKPGLAGEPADAGRLEKTVIIGRGKTGNSK
ncbi:MAG: hypothetical protein R6T92_11575 [Desulfosalsimonadaceae bacterium]